MLKNVTIPFGKKKKNIRDLDYNNKPKKKNWNTKEENKI